MPVYFLQAGDSDRVKIGWADDPEQRRYDLQTGHYEELRIVRVLDGEPWMERWLHRHYRERRVRGEWFAWCPTMADIAPVKAEAPACRADAFPDISTATGILGDLLRDVEAFCLAHGMTPRDFGYAAVGDGRLIERALVRKMSLRTFAKVEAFLLRSIPVRQAEAA